MPSADQGYHRPFSKPMLWAPKGAIAPVPPACGLQDRLLPEHLRIAYLLWG